MAPRIGRTTPRRRSYGPSEHQGNGDIPPSTLAAQIADRMVDPHHDSRDHDSENFQLLLHELLEASDPTSQPESNLADDAAVNSRLICVIVRAGLGKSRTGQGVDEQQERRSDAIRSLQAIDLIISRSPEILFHPLDAFDPTIAPGTPQFAWLLPRILAEVKEHEPNDPEEHVLAIIKHSMLLGGKSQTRCSRTSPITRYVHASITEKLPTPDSLLNSEVCQALREVSSLAQRSTAIFHSHREMILPTLLKIVNAPDHFASLSNELQHAIMSALRYGETNDPLSRGIRPGQPVVPIETTSAVYANGNLAEASSSRSDVDIDDGPRKRLRLEDSSTGSSNAEDVGSVVNRRILQSLRLPETTALTEALANIKYATSRLSQ
ncbi:MAG: hypothetical protein Q9168_003728 [Polycauliona sp. 1 TL-2023]